jgi:hypothetical protein
MVVGRHYILNSLLKSANGHRSTANDAFNAAYQEKIKRAVQLSYNKYCGIAAMLKKHSPIHVQVVIEE